MNSTDTFLALCDVYCEAKKIARPTLSGLMLRDSRTLDRVADGGSLTVRNFDRCLQWLSDHWPVGLSWPESAPPRPRVLAHTSDAA